MKKGDYLDAKQEKRKSTSQAIVVLIIFIIVFIAVIFRFAIRSGTNEGFFSSMPTGSDAYDVSREFIRPTINSGDDADFPEEDFQYSRNSDSVYVVKSYFVTKDNSGQDIRTNFSITLRYNGGASSKKRNWTMVNLKEN